MVVAILALVACAAPSEEQASSRGAKATVQAPAPKGVKVATDTIAPTKVPKAAPTKTMKKEQPTPSPKGEDEMLDISAVSELSRFDSYRLSQRISWQQEGGTKESMTFLIEFVREPPAGRYVVTSGGGAHQMEIIRIGDSNYMGVDGKWRLTQVSSDSFLEQAGWWGQPDALLAPAKGKYLGKEKVNGLDTRHYRYEGNVLLPIKRLDKIEKVTADVWVSTKYDVYTKVIIAWERVDQEGGKGTLSMESTLIDINEPITIKAPEGVKKPTMPDDVPVAEDAKNLTLMDNVISYQVSRPEEEMIAFYKREMPANGWQEQKSPVPVMLDFTKGSRTAKIVLTRQGQMTVVNIVTGEK